jgi:hypothetical protein
MYQFSYVKFSSTNQDANLVLLDDPSRVTSQITSGLYPEILKPCAEWKLRGKLWKAWREMENRIGVKIEVEP